MFGKSKLVADPKPRAPSAPAPASSSAPAPVERAPALGVLPAAIIKPSIISDAVNFIGDLRSEGALHIDGNAKGTIEADSVTVGTSGSLEGTVSCKKLHIKGNLAGNVTCDELVISHEAHVAGTLAYKTILIQRGARVVGEFCVIVPA